MNLPSIPAAISHIIFDLDGLLLNTESIHEAVNQTVAQRYGKVYSPVVKAQVVGKRALESSQAFVDALELPLTAEACLAARYELLWERYGEAQLMPGAQRLTAHFKQSGVPMAIATSSHRRNFELKTVHHQDWLTSFDCIVRGDDPELAAGKPAPDIFLLAAQRLGVDPSHCLVFEDSPAGVTAARRAGMAVVVVPDPDLDLALFAGADQVLPSLEVFEPAAWQLPPFCPSLTM
jgi:HAD superfamily hydrolase (TIGR01509 family)